MVKANVFDFIIQSKYMHWQKHSIIPNVHEYQNNISSFFFSRQNNVDTYRIDQFDGKKFCGLLQKGHILNILYWLMTELSSSLSGADRHTLI